MGEPSLTQLLGLEAGGRVAVCGCGGKTSLVSRLAQENENEPVLVSPAAKILPMKPNGAVCQGSVEEALAHKPQAGVQCLGVYTRCGGVEKLGPLPTDMLHAMLPLYHLVLMEADGSRGLPCKGWRRDEPVIPYFTTHTLGVVNVRAAGLPATAAHVHRLPLFLSLTGLEEGQPIPVEALATMVAGPGGLMRYAAGKRLLFLNGVERPEDEQNARRLAALLREGPGDICTIVAGSLREQRWLRLL